MFVLGADMHKSSHTIAAVAASTGELLGDRTVEVGEPGFAAALDWAREVDAERVWALEDCRHVSAALERFLLVNGERVVRVATRLMAGERRGARDRGKSDHIDAIAVARAALREGLDRLPLAQLAGVELEIRLLVDHRERLVRIRTSLNNDLDLWPEQMFPKSALMSKKWSGRIERRLARVEQSRAGADRARRAAAPARALRDDQHVRGPGRRPRRADRAAPALSARLRRVDRRQADRRSRRRRAVLQRRQLARAGGLAPIPVSSGKSNRHRLDRGGNRQINTAIHRIAVTPARCDPESRDYVARKRAEGKSHSEAIRCLKRHLTRRIWHLLRAPAPETNFLT